MVDVVPKEAVHEQKFVIDNVRYIKEVIVLNMKGMHSYLRFRSFGFLLP